MKYHAEELIALFDRYGPNALKVDAYVRRVRELNGDELAVVFYANWRRNGNRSQLMKLVQSVGELKGHRSAECDHARSDGEKALKCSTSESKLISGLIAVAFVLEDFLGREERNVLELYVVNPVIPLQELYESYEDEDFAFDVFCEKLTVMDEHPVYVTRRLDLRGQAGEGLADLIVNRMGLDYVVEHTQLNSYERREHYRKLWDKFIKPLDIEEKVRTVYPNKWINIFIPVNAFENERQARDFDFDGFMKNLIDAVGKTPDSYNASKEVTYRFPETPFDVTVSNGGEDYRMCLLIQIAPTNEDRMETELEKEMVRAIDHGRKKLQKPKAAGERTVLLLDSSDHALVNEQILANAFTRVVERNQTIVNDIDQVYILHARRLVVPVKLDDRRYPDLPEFRHYILKQNGL